MMDPQLEMGATQESRIFTGSALATAPAPSRATVNADSANFSERMNSSLAAYAPRSWQFEWLNSRQKLEHPRAGKASAAKRHILRA
jgi:hypothetical protein